MKSIFRTIVFAAVLLVAVSCNIDWVYIQVPNTNWTITQDEQQAFVHFGAGDRCCILQRSNVNGAVQFINGTYLADGHAVDVLSDEGSSNRLIRTFSHLKKKVDFGGSLDRYTVHNYFIFSPLRNSTRISFPTLLSLYRLSIRRA